MYSREEKKSLFYLQKTDGIGNVTIRKLKESLGMVSKVWNMEDQELALWLNKRQRRNLLQQKENYLKGIEYGSLLSKGIHYVTCFEEGYPERLKTVADAPVGLFVRGRFPDENIPSVAVVGARNHSYYGETATEAIVKELAKRHFQIVSGMASGIDGIAGRTSTELLNPNFAVLGCGVDVCYPLSNRNIYEKLPSLGGVISEYVPGIEPAPDRFPPRNRIISGLADVVVVIEARQKSGTFITVDMALEQGREVYALPGRIEDPLSMGCNQLIKQGAGIITSAELFAEELEQQWKTDPRFAGFFACENGKKNCNMHEPKLGHETLSNEEYIVLECLESTPISIETLQERMNQKKAVTIPELLQILNQLELLGAICCVGNLYYRKL